MAVVHCMRASDLWIQELRGPFLTWLSAKVSYISVVVSGLLLCVFTLPQEEILLVPFWNFTAV